MADKRRRPTAYSIFIGVLVILLILSIALFIYGSANNGVARPVLPGKGVFALWTTMHHG